MLLMDKDDVVATVEAVLDDAGWQHAGVSTRCFDLFASDSDRSLILKVAANVDGTGRDDADEMKRACRFLGASPLVVGARTSRRALEPQVVYERYGIPTVRPDTLDAYLRLQERTPVMHRRGGYYVAIDPDKLEERRKEEGYSRNALAKEVGVSRKTIDNYRERGVARPETAERLEATLGDVAATVDILDTRVSAETTDHPVADRFARFGMETTGFSRAPFDAAARDDEDRFVARRHRGTLSDTLHRFLRDLTALSDTTTVLVTRDREEYSGLATIRRRDLQQAESKDEFKDRVTDQ